MEETINSVDKVVEKNPLETKPIMKLLAKFAIPSVISLLVNALYNIVDQIFIGQGVGYLGNGATNVVFPITVIALAFALMTGDGAASFLSLKLGEKQKSVAEKGVTNAIVFGVVISIILTLVFVIFLEPILNLFGVTDAIRPYALDYGYIILIGLPFSIISTILNSIIRADGSPKYAMASMIVGAVINTILDPIAIFILNKGVQGAAVATVLGQFVSFLVSVVYLRKFKTIKIKKENLKIDFKTLKTVLSLGISSFITQIAITVVMAVSNNLLTKYGATSKYGAEIPLTALGIVMKVNQIMTSIIVGIAIGAQPIIGYNYGAGKYSRVKKTFKYAVIIATIIAIICFIIFQFFPQTIINLFGSEEGLYNEFAQKCFKIFLLFTALNAFQIVSGMFFQALGKGMKSALLSLSRQICLLLPAQIILASIYGIDGILYGGPVADLLAFILAAILVILQIKKLNKNIKTEEGEITQEILTASSEDKKIIITISREYGSGGRYIGQKLADELGISFYDKNLITLAAEESGLSKEYVEENEQKVENKLAFNLSVSGYYSNNMFSDENMATPDSLFISLSNCIKKIAERESCVIVGRCADYILKDNKDCFNVFIYSTKEDKMNRAKTYYGLNEKQAKNEIAKINKARANHYEHYTNRKWGDKENYDLCINCNAVGIDGAVNLIKEAVS